MSNNAFSVEKSILNEAKQELIEEANKLLLIDYEIIRKDRFTKKIFCPHCLHSTGKLTSNYVLFGFVNNTKWQRYQCRQCNRIFSDLTNSFFHRSRNIHKWPIFIKLLMVDRLSLKHIAHQLNLHVNTIYAWNKKLISFFEHFLPNNNSPTFNTDTHDFATFSIKYSPDIKLSENTNFNPEDNQASNNIKDQITSIPITIGFNREYPSIIHVKIEHIRRNQTTAQCSSFSKLLTTTISDFNCQYTSKRKKTISILQREIIFFRMLRLCQSINPVLLPHEIMKICLDKGNLFAPKRLLKRLI